MRVANLLRGSDEALNMEAVKAVLQAAMDMGVRMVPPGTQLTAAERNAAPDTTFLDAQGFTMSWMSDNARTFVGRDEEGKTVAFAHMIYGRQYTEPTISASIMLLFTKTDAQRQTMLNLLRDHARMLGASVLLFEGKDGDVLPSEPLPMRAHKIG